jgi:predicted transcriptional regulator of viral defense system
MAVAGRADRAIRGKLDQHRGRLDAVAALAAKQHGVVARWQLIRLGLSTDAIDRLITASHLHVIHRGVYAVGHTRLTPRGRWTAAVLACGPDALLSHASAMALRDLILTSSPTIHVTVATRSGRARRRGIRLHRSTTLHPDDVDRIDGIPVTSLPRTLVDFAELAKPGQLQRILEQADARDILDVAAVDAALHRGRRRPGATRPTAALIAYRPSERVLRFELERRFHAILRRAGLPLPATNTWVVCGEVDAYWEKYGLVVELDGRTYHERRAAFQRDRERDRALQLAGLRAVRFTWDDVNEPAMVERTVRQLLVLGGYRG